MFASEDEPRRFFGPARDLGASAGGPAPPRLGEPLSAEDAARLMHVVGPPELPSAWKQGFFFAGYRPYGLQQVEGGPCGVIAALQAFMLRALLERAVSPDQVLEVDEKLRKECLVDALCEVLFRNAGDGKKAVILVPSAAGSAPFTAAALRCLQPATFTSYDQLRAALLERQYGAVCAAVDRLGRPQGHRGPRWGPHGRRWLEKAVHERQNGFPLTGCIQPPVIEEAVPAGGHDCSPGAGVALFLYSLVWTRGVENILERDADDAKTLAMIGGHGYCTQELVNLMVFGRAYSNVFDGTKRLGSAQDGWCVLQGVPKRASVGFLSLFEAFKCIEVGSRLKGPFAPVWIVCAESHYTVLFAADAAAAGDPRDAERPVDLYYFDQLARQNDSIKLSVTPGRLPGHLSTGFEEGESMIELCIRTKWKDATVDWNGTEPIL